MPKINKRRSVTRKAGRNLLPGKSKKGPGRPRIDGKAKTAPAIIANSIFALTLKPKPGLEVVDKTAVKKPRSYYDHEDDYGKMYKDLLKCFQHACKTYKGVDTWADPLEGGLDIGASITFVIKGFENQILPKGFNYNIDRNDQGKYYFTIYQECDFQQFWHAFEIKPIVKKLQNKNKPLHDLFIEFMKAFMIETGINGWYDGGMGYADFQMEEEIENWKENHGDDEDEIHSMEKAKKTFEDYQNGIAKTYETLLKRTKFRSVKYLLSRLSKFSNRNPLVQWMTDACALMDQPCNINLFIYHEFEEENGEGLRFDQQAAVIWDWDDAYTDIQEECLDSEASGIGVLPPLLNIQITQDTKKIDFEQLVRSKHWPQDLTAIWNKYADIVQKLKNKKNK